MKATKETHPLLWLWHEDMSGFERRFGIHVDDALYKHFREEAEKTCEHLSKEEKDAWAIYNAHMHPGHNHRAPVLVVLLIRR